MKGTYAARAHLSPDARAIVAILKNEIVRVGWSETARLAGVDRCSLHRAFSNAPSRTRNPSFATVMAVADALGLEFTVRKRPS